MGLDDRFGAVRPPVRVDEEERKFRPHSLQCLNARTAERLSLLLRAAHSSCGLIAATAFHRLPILWVVDQAGDIWLALEEVVFAQTGALAFPLAKNFPYYDKLERDTGDSRCIRLGHPALLGGGAGRIGGEIMFDPGRECWYISNASRRYGRGRKKLELDEVVTAFRNYGIELVALFDGRSE